jgi:hypothetical protein
MHCGFRGVFATAVLALFLSACGSSDEPQESADVSDSHGGTLPDRYGLYAVQGDQIDRLDGDQSFELSTWGHRSALAPDVTFIVYDRRLADPSIALDQAIELERVPHVRNEVSSTGAAAPATANNWVASDLPKFAVPVDFQPVPSALQMVRVIPSRPLEPGLYSLQLRTGSGVLSGRFGVKWDKVDKVAYMATYCVDRYAGAAAPYRVCGEAVPAAQLPPTLTTQPLAAAPPPALAAAPQAAPAAPGATLQVRNVQAVRRNDGGMTTLLVQGDVVNASQAPQNVPQLIASLRDQRGTEVKHWVFTAEVSRLMPGGTTGFRTEVLDSSTGPTQVSIAFAGGNGGSQ